MPIKKEPCRFCKGTGKRASTNGFAGTINAKCRYCKGTGERRPSKYKSTEEIKNDNR